MARTSPIKLALAVLVLSSGAAWAQGTGTGPVADQCKSEIAKLCSDKSHGGREVRNCLESKTAELSAGCKQALATTGPGKGMGSGKR